MLTLVCSRQRCQCLISWSAASALTSASSAFCVSGTSCGSRCLPQRPLLWRAVVSVILACGGNIGVCCFGSRQQHLLLWLVSEATVGIFCCQRNWHNDLYKMAASSSVGSGSICLCWEMAVPHVVVDGDTICCWRWWKYVS